MYKRNALEGAHVIKLGPGNDKAAREALAAWPGHLQIGGGITDSNAQQWLNAGASKVNLCLLLSWAQQAEEAKEEEKVN